ncbi:hypothetical protein [Chitinophaga sp. S165]|uniref:hypothetical protein n=1 Tax=Chitinophaga sp. S165 TaxID=2135462 RepID=UPI000D70F1F7|nr:hypothetical protein [Chitinophaga sp. S165]PWV55881.1 hypothetical protein C7475_101391 [Chitinophaga sp. S165]
MRRSIAIIILVFSVACSGEYSYNSLKISTHTKEIVSKISTLNVLAGRAVGEGGIRPEEYDNFIELKNKATNAELTELTDHPNGVVRCYAFWALSYDTTANLLPIVIRHLNDTIQVRTQFGCIGRTEDVGDIFIDIAQQSYDLDSKKLTLEESEYLDSVLIYTSNRLYAKERAIKRGKLTARFYGRVKELMLKDGNQSALIALAKFRRKEDIPLILKNSRIEQRNGLFNTYKAIGEFPDPAFRPLLQESLHDVLVKASWDSESAEMYNAIASFKDDTAYRQLEKPFKKITDSNIRKHHIAFVFNAIRKHYSPVYNDLLWEIWENEMMISPDVFSLLYKQQPQKAFQVTKKTIQNIELYYLNQIVDYDNYEKKPVNLMDVMLDTLIAHDRTMVVKMIYKNIKDINAPLYNLYADKVLALRDDSCVKALLSRLEIESSPYAYLKIAEVLVAFGDENMKREIVEISKRNVQMKQEWAREDFAKLLNGHNIKY